MVTSRRSLLALIVGLALLLGQQAAWTHLVSHLGGQSATSVTPTEAPGEAGDGLSLVCGACLAFAGLDAGPASQAQAPVLSREPVLHLVAALAFRGETLSRPFLARAPPAVS
jgi:hypothetical protein